MVDCDKFWNSLLKWFRNTDEISHNNMWREIFWENIAESRNIPAKSVIFLCWLIFRYFNLFRKETKIIAFIHWIHCQWVASSESSKKWRGIVLWKIFLSQSFCQICQSSWVYHFYFLIGSANDMYFVIVTFTFPRFFEFLYFSDNDIYLFFI